MRMLVIVNVCVCNFLCSNVYSEIHRRQCHLTEASVSVPRMVVLSDVFLEEGQRSAPGVFGGYRVVVPGFVVKERVAGSGVDLYVVRDAVAFERRLEFAPGSCGEVLFGIGADDGAGAGDGVERVQVHAVERGHYTQTLVSAGPGDREPAAHAEADSPEPRAVHSWTLGEDA